MDAATDWVVSGGRYALDLDGINDFITINSERALDFGIGDFSSSGWFFVRNVSSVRSAFFAENNPGAGGSQWWLRQENTSGAIRFLTGDSVGETSVTTGNGVIAANEWTHLACVRKDTEISIWKNGEILNTATGDVRNVSSSQAVTIGRFSTLYLDGLFSDVLLHNRAIFPGEMETLSSRRGIAFERRKRRSVFFDAAFFNPAWARNSNVILSPVGAA